MSLKNVGSSASALNASWAAEDQFNKKQPVIAGGADSYLLRDKCGMILVNCYGNLVGMRNDSRVLQISLIITSWRVLD